MAKNEKSEAAEKIEKAAKAKSAGSPKAKKGNIFKRIGAWFAKFGKDFKGEVKKITWPGAKMVLKSTAVVLVAIIVIGLAVFAIDWCLSRGVDGLESLATKISENQDAEGAADADAETADGTENAAAATQAAADTAITEAATTEAATTEAATTEAATTQAAAD